MNSINLIIELLEQELVESKYTKKRRCISIQIEIVRVNVTRKYLNKSRFRTRKESELVGQIVMNDY